MITDAAAGVRAAPPATRTDTTGTDADVLELLAPWRTAGVMSAADVHVAATLCRLTGVGVAAPDVVVATALAARAPRMGHTCLDLATVATSAAAEVEGDRGVRGTDGIDDLPWPTDIDAWRAALAASPLVEVLIDGRPPEAPSSPPRPLALNGTRLYLERYLAYERRVAAELLRRAAAPPADAPLPDARRIELLQALVPLAPGQAPDDSPQWSAATAGASRPLSVIVGGPGTGKTQTVAALLALLRAGDPSGRLRITLAAPTGKAAARMGEAFHAVAGQLRHSGLPDVDELADELDGARATTVHALLGARPGTVRTRHHAGHPLVEDVVIVDETSMVSLPLMARLLDAIGPDARVILVGDPGQLTSVEAGSVLGDIAGAAIDATFGERPAPDGPLAACVSVLSRSFRFPPGSRIDRFARAVGAGDATTAVALLSDADTDVGTEDVGADGVRLAWIDAPGDRADARTILVDEVGAAAECVRDRAERGEVEAALAALSELQVLCAHRRGPFGVSGWNRLVEDALAAAKPLAPGFYLGRPVLIPATDRANGLFNGDIGVVVATPGGVRVAFAGAGEPRLLAPVRLDAVETVHAMTIHKSQGSEFDHVVVVLPPPDSRLATRELLYTAVTRARRVVTLVGDEAAVARAVTRRVVRASGLADRLWSGGVEP
jgi:exodeoxyribonuclease V alpha subunit